MLQTIMSSKHLDWLYCRSPWLFVLILYGTRWVFIGLASLIDHLVFNEAQRSEASVPAEMAEIQMGILFVLMILIAPFFETLVECSLPYLILSRFERTRPIAGRRPWIFIWISASIMVLLHPILAALLPALITGLFLAYCYAQFAASSHLRAIFATTLFHGAINLVGWIMILLSRDSLS